MRLASRGRARMPAPQLSDRASFAAWPPRRTTPSRHYVMIIAGILAALAFAALVARRESLAVAAVGGAAVLLLALRWISGLALALIPAMVLSDVPLHNMKPAAILIGVLAFATVVLFCVGSLRVRSPHVWVAVMAVMVLLAYVFPEAHLAPGKETQQTFVWMLGGLVMITIFIASPPPTSGLLMVILVTGAISGIVALAQRDYVEGRLQGLGLNPNYLAVYLAVPIVISVGLAIRHRNALWLAPGAVCLPALLATQSREGFLAMLAGSLFLVIQGRSQGQRILIALAAIMPVLVAPGRLRELTFLGAGSRSMMELSSDNLVRVRVALFAMHTALGHPLLGIGFGQFPNYAAASSSFGLYIITTNEYLLLASETGLITLAAFLVLLWLALRGPCHGEMVIVRAAIVACAVSMLFVDSFESPIVALPFWACLGVLLTRKPAQCGTEPAASRYAGTGRTEVSR